MTNDKQRKQKMNTIQDKNILFILHSGYQTFLKYFWS